MKMYLGAGVYWDAGTDGPNQQTYTSPYSGTCHAGLWVMKKAYIGQDVTGTVSTTPMQGRPADINKYFFLPAAGCHHNHYYNQGSKGYYWSSSSGDADHACSLVFNSSSADVDLKDIRDFGYLPMVAE